MATKIGEPSTALDKQGSKQEDQARFRDIRKLLEQEPFRVQFFQAVRMLQRMEQGRKPVGHFITPHNEAIRFCAFRPSPFHQVNSTLSSRWRTGR